MTESVARQGKLVTLIAPAFDEADNAAELVTFFHRVRDSRPEFDFELIVVDDGSSDGTPERVLDALQAGDDARVISLSRRFGSHAALSAGLDASRGDCVITISTDIQEPLEVIGRFLDHWLEGHEVVWGVRATRADAGRVSKRTSRGFSRLFQRFSGMLNYPAEGPSQALLARPVIDAVCAMPERNRNLWAIVAWLGFAQTTIAFHQVPRRAGRSKWSTTDRLKLMVDSIVGFSVKPFVITLVLGLLLGFGGLLEILVLLIVAPGMHWGLVLGATCLLAGMQLTVFGGMGLYLWRIADDARARPLYVVRQVRR